LQNRKRQAGPGEDIFEGAGMKETSCDLCGCRHYEVVYHIKNLKFGQPRGPGYKITEDAIDMPSLRIVRCLRCGLVYLNPREGADEILVRYKGMEDDVYAGEERGRRIAARIILKKISRYKRKGRILDIGCATGFLLDEAKKQGWEAYGVELSKWAANFAREKFGLNIFEGLLKDAKFPYNYFDAITMIDSIEHLSSPKEELEEVRRILKPNGVLCISTPDIDSFLSKFLEAKWWGIKQAHLFYFSRKTLSRMLDAVGFKAVKFSSHVRVFSVEYWSLRLKGYSKVIYRIFNIVSKVLAIRNKLIKLSFKDQIEVYVQKKRALAYIDMDERQASARERKMKTVVVLPAYNAEKTLALTLKDIPRDIVDDIILVDDASRDNTVEVARGLGLEVFAHPKNKGYGGNQKTCYTKALEMGAEIVVMVHPDYQYDPTIIPELVKPIQKGQADAVFGSRMMKGGALEGGMPIWKHNANILLTALENVILGTYLTEYHSGFRAYSAKYLKTVNFLRNCDGFVFDTEIIVQGLIHYLKIDEVPIRTRYFDEASSIKFLPSVIYGFGILKTLLKFLLHTRGIARFRQFE
jgi:2-polyprenyl-3-methyl-5-hydroxy-6-metoxy-1,4-benzoquinol methylase